MLYKPKKRQKPVEAKPTLRVSYVQAPIGGLNERDPLDNMLASDAIMIENWWPLASHLEVRKGSKQRNHGLKGPINTIFEYSPKSGQNILFAATSNGVYNISKDGAVVEGLPFNHKMDDGIKSIWEVVKFSLIDKNAVLLLNGRFSPIIFCGEKWEYFYANSMIPAEKKIALSNVYPNNATYTWTTGCVHKSRLYLVRKDSFIVDYSLKANEFLGEIKELDIGNVFKRGGSLLGMYTWTVDAGDGLKENAVFISTNGEVAVFEGDNPSDIDSWSLIGLFYIGKIAGKRGVVKYGAELLITTEAGIFELSRCLSPEPSSSLESLTEKVNNTIGFYTRDADIELSDCEICVYPGKSALLINFTRNKEGLQLVMNCKTGAWTKFTGWPAYTIVDTSFGLLYGGHGKVYRAWVGDSDFDRPIEAKCLQSFQYFEYPERKKHFKMVRPEIKTNGGAKVSLQVNGDSELEELQRPFREQNVWGEFNYEFTWNDSWVRYNTWACADSLCNSAALMLRVLNEKSTVKWTNTMFGYELGGIF